MPRFSSMLDIFRGFTWLLVLAGVGGGWRFGVGGAGASLRDLAGLLIGEELDNSVDRRDFAGLEAPLPAERDLAVSVTELLVLPAE